MGLKSGAQSGLAAFASIALVAVIFSFPALLNGSPFLFPDSDAYYRVGRSIVTTLTGSKARSETSVLTTGAGEGPDSPGAASAEPVYQASAAAPAKHNLDLTLWSARSPHYGILLYTSAAAAGLWGIAGLQALTAAIALWRAAMLLAGSEGTRVFWLWAATAALGTSLPWFAGFAMPDVWIGFAALMLAAVMFSGGRAGLLDYGLLAVLCGAAAAFHTANLAVLALAIPLAAVVALAFRVTARREVFAAGAAAAAGYAGAIFAWWAFGAVVEKKYGEPLTTPIFATARIVADGPGREHLRTACATDVDRYALCKFRELPLDDSNDIIWSDNPARGVYTVADYDTRVALSHEQWRFVADTTISDPWAVVGIAIGHALTQLTRFSLADFAGNHWAEWSKSSYWSDLAIFEALPSAAACLKSPASCAPPEITRAFDVLQQGIVLAALALLAWSLWRFKPWRSNASAEDRLIGALGCYVVLVLVINAGVCGALSGPVDRYQARLIWLVPMTAVLIAALKWSALRGPAPAHD